MPIDPSIALGVKPMQVKSQGEYLNELYNQQNAEQTNQLNQMKMGEYKRGLAEDEQFKNALARLDKTSPTFEQDRYNAYALKGIEGVKAYAATKKEEALAESAGVETTGKRLANASAAQTATTKSINDTYNRPDDNNLNVIYDDAVDSGLYDKTMLANMKRRKDSILAIPVGEIDPTTGRPDLSARRQAIIAMQLEAKDRLGKPGQRDIGGSVQDTMVDPITGIATVTGTTAKTRTFADKISAGNLKVAQDRLQAELNAGVELSPESIDFAANVYTQTGLLPPLGIGGKAGALKTKILNRGAYLAMHPEASAAVNPAAPGATTPPVAPPVSAADAAGNVTQNKQNVAVAVKTLKDFSTGVQGQQVASFNTALNHLDTLERLGNDLNNSDIKVVNRAANLFAKELGVAAPTSFDAAKKIVGAEIQKAIVRANGTGSEREEAAAAFDTANSPAQLAGVFSSVRELLGGQLVTLKQQYESNAGPKAKPFTSKLNAAARKQLEALTGGKTSTTSAPAPAAKTALPLKNNQGWILHIDANGNKAYVSSDGQVKEVK